MKNTNKKVFIISINMKIKLHYKLIIMIFAVKVIEELTTLIIITS